MKLIAQSSLLIMLTFLGSCRLKWGQGTSSTSDQASDLTLMTPDSDLKLFLEPKPGVNSLNTSANVEVFAARNAGEPRLKVYYVDFESQSDHHLKTYPGSLVVQMTGTSADVWFLLPDRVSSPSWGVEPYNYVYFGHASFAANGASLTPIQPFYSNLKLSIISSQGAANGQVGVHYSKDVAYQNRAPVTSSTKLCSVLNEKDCSAHLFEDFCGGSIESSACLPPPPPPNGFLAKGRVFNLKERSTKGTYLWKQVALPKKTNAKLTFVSGQVAASPATNQALCESQTEAMPVSALDGRRNPTCQLKLEPSVQPIDGKLACTMSLEFVNPIEVSDYGCNVKFIFLGSEPEVQTVQVLAEMIGT